MASIFPLEIVTPEKVFYKGDVEMVITRTTQGDRAVLKNHIPFVVGLVNGELRIKKDGKFISGQISEGFMTVSKEKTTILTESAKWNDEVKGL
ncbi:FoF1 ATP synthase subunit delta/epsilon [Terrisporobacter sp.]|uniref:FoF1 ATP synthase subunit delta/epsilon n=1 Tax=Terrisporobacter sp. TaxID=1965305 RepID=UPI0026108D64|nr:F0F1 ATP synthase subunit epsilon [Terrisporobacter sp.]